MIDFKKISQKLPDINYTYVTSFLKDNNKPFDGMSIAEKVTKKENSEYFGIPPEEIVEYWGLSNDFGNKQHRKIEYYFKENKKCEYSDFLESENLTHENCYAEVPVVSHKYRLTGKIDIVEHIKKDGNNFYKVWDTKTSKKFTADKILEASKQILLYCVMLNEHLPAGDKAVPGKIIHIGNTSKPTDYDVNLWKPSRPRTYIFDKECVDLLNQILLKRNKNLLENVK
jgi:hypothetical protein